MLSEIAFKNWLCFRGDHVIKLGAKAYAITAQYEIDPGRSNRGGKSAIFEAVQFATTDLLNKDRRFDADGWITEGEKDGWVRLTLEDGMSITVSRERGKSTKLKLSDGSTQAEARAKWLKHLSFDAEDFQTVAYFAQGAMARIIRTEPEKRFDIIRGWLGLEKAERAETRAAEIAAGRVREVQKLKARLSTVVDMMTGAQAVLPEEDIAAMNAERLDARARFNEVNAERQAFYARREHEALIQRFEEIIFRGKAVAKEIEAYASDLPAQITKLDEEYRILYATAETAKRNAASKKLVTLGKFDGKCPVATLTCPATEQINKGRTEANAAYEKARWESGAAEILCTSAAAEISKLRAEHNVLYKKEANRDMLRTQASEIRDAVIAARRALKTITTRGFDEIEGELRSTRETIELLSAKISGSETRAKHAEQLTAEHASISHNINITSLEAAAATQTRAVFRAVQRRLAERALNTISNRANDMLLESGDDLTIGIKWEHEGKNLARACEMCGMSFPQSAKVKVCETCGAERGQNIIQRLEFVLSASSGGADDLAGIVMQIAAGSWLLTARESPWACALIDEPFSQMDETVRRAAAKQLIKLLGTSAFRQVLVISHAADTVSMYPGRINIIVAKDGSRRIETK